MLNTALLPRPWSCHEPKDPEYRPLISCKITRISRSKRLGWRCCILVDGAAMSTSHYNTKAEAERQGEKMLPTYTDIHYKSK